MATVLRRGLDPGAGAIRDGAAGQPPPAAIGREDEPPPGLGFDPVRFGLLAFMVTVSMLFVSFTSAYVVRRAAADWAPLALPPLLYLNTLLLVASSFTLECARRSRGARHLWLVTTAALAAGFMLGQLGAWGQLAELGFFLASNPHSSFFYMLTGVHGLHLVGGFSWLLVLVPRSAQGALAPESPALGRLAIFWHFLTALWLYLLLLLFVI